MKRDQDLTSNCLTPEVGIDDLRRTFCERCRNPVCRHAQAEPAAPSWQDRMSTQVDRLLLNPEIAKPGDSRFERFKGMDFPSLLQQSIRIAASESRGDWSVDSTDPAGFTETVPEVPVTPEPTPPLTPKDPAYYKVTEIVTNRRNQVTATQPAPEAPVVIQPPMRNTPVPQGGIVIGVVSPPETDNGDPWSPKSEAPRERIVPVGGKIRM